MRKPPLKGERWLAWEGTRLQGLVEYFQHSTRYHPHKFSLDLLVHPEAEGRGIGRALYEHLMSAMAAHAPETLWIMIREDKARGRRFAEERGFSEKMLSWESRLDLASYDPTRFAAALERAAGAGIAIKDLTQLADDPDRDRKLYEMRNPIIRDVPSPGETTDESFERFVERFWQNPSLIPEACFVALDGPRYVGYTGLYATPGEPLLYTGLTGVSREYRGRGIAQALKVKSLSWAKGSGHKEVATWNESRNVEMLAVNEKLGFVRKHGWIDYEKTCRADELADGEEARS